MHPEPRKVQAVYLVLTLCTTLAGSFIWGINTLFLLDAGLSITAAFAANACFTAGMVLFEVPTGVVADTWGRRASFLLGWPGGRRRSSGSGRQARCCSASGSRSSPEPPRRGSWTP
jgi:MFS family permease